MSSLLKSRILKWLPLVSLLLLPPATAQASLLDDIRNRNALRVCIWPDYFAISYRNPRTQALEGIDIDMARALARWLDVRLDFVETSFAELIPNMTERRCDIAMHGVGVRDSRKPHMDFSNPHLRSGIYAVAMRSNDSIRRWQDIDQPGNIVVVQKGTYMEPVMRDLLQHAELSVVDSFKAREQEVLSGRADVFMTDYPYGKRMSALTRWANLLAPEQPLAPTPYAWAVPKDEPQWLATVNDFLEEMKNRGQLRQSAATHGLLPIVQD